VKRTKLTHQQLDMNSVLFLSQREETNWVISPLSFGLLSYQRTHYLCKEIGQVKDRNLLGPANILLTKSCPEIHKVKLANYGNFAFIH
jgi:hypothetical protein